MSKPSSRSIAARRDADALLGRAQKREQSFKLDQEREYESMVLKTARLRELRLAKEAAEKEAKAAAAPVPRSAKSRRSKQT